jgi:hypothetical protein
MMGSCFYISHIGLPIAAVICFPALDLHSWRQRDRYAASPLAPPIALEHSLSLRETVPFFAAVPIFVRAMP